MADLTLPLNQPVPTGSRKVNAPVAQNRKNLNLPLGPGKGNRILSFSQSEASAGPALVDSSGKIYGTVLMEGVLTRGVRVGLYSRATGRLMANTVTASDGSFTFKGLDSALAEGYFVVAFDPAEAPSFNAKIFDKLTPERSDPWLITPVSGLVPPGCGIPMVTMYFSSSLVNSLTGLPSTAFTAIAPMFDSVLARVNDGSLLNAADPTSNFAYRTTSNGAVYNEGSGLEAKLGFRQPVGMVKLSALPTGASSRVCNYTLYAYVDGAWISQGSLPNLDFVAEGGFYPLKEYDFAASVTASSDRWRICTTEWSAGNSGNHYVGEVQMFAKSVQQVVEQSDPFQAQVYVNLRCDGEVGSGTFIDTTGRTWTTEGSAVHTNPPPSGFDMFNTCALINQGQNITHAQSPQMAMNGDFTIEFWGALTDVASAQMAILARYLVTYGAGAWGILIYPGSILWSGLQQASGGPGHSITLANPNQFRTWTHVAFCKASGILRCFIDGNLVDERADAFSYTNSWPLSIGRWDTSNVNNRGAHLRNLRITGAARYTTNFTPPHVYATV